MSTSYLAGNWLEEAFWRHRRRRWRPEKAVGHDGVASMLLIKT